MSDKEFDERLGNTILEIHDYLQEHPEKLAILRKRREKDGKALTWCLKCGAEVDVTDAINTITRVFKEVDQFNIDKIMGLKGRYSHGDNGYPEGYCNGWDSAIEHILCILKGEHEK